jgi:hypothetical protein
MRHRLIAVTSMLLRHYFGHEGSVFSRTEQVLQRVREETMARTPKTLTL